jgi:hypothetical protein
MNKLVESLKHYLSDTLKTSIEANSWKKQNSLPFFLTDNYYFYEISIHRTRCLLMISRGHADITPGTIRKHWDQIQKQWDGPIIFIQSAISSYNRKRLIEQHIPFIVPGNQMYLPHIGIDLREYFRKIHSKQNNAFSPSTQTVVIYSLLRKTNEKLNPSILAEKLGYTLMTITRAFHELQAAEIGEFYQKGKERYWTFSDKKALWEQTKEFLCSPVRKRIWVKTDIFKISAGLSALSHYSQLIPPSVPIFAIGAKQWDYCKKSGIKEIQTSDDASLELEIWSYNPELFAKNGFVDIFSLYLSLEVGGDERVELALEEMMEKIKW